MSNVGIYIQTERDSINNSTKIFFLNNTIKYFERQQWGLGCCNDLYVKLLVIKRILSTLDRTDTNLDNDQKDCLLGTLTYLINVK